MNKSFVFGVIVGVGGLWTYHKFVKPVPSSAVR